MLNQKPDYISQADWNDVDVPELTDEEFAQMKPASVVDPKVVKAYEQGDLNASPLIHSSKQRITIRLDADLIETFKAQAKAHGGNYQTEINAALRQHLQKNQLVEAGHHHRASKHS
ncbi:MAG: BrnA antitoxin family protein [Mariprofundales bacterium]|nr:BrnA antitoxin family protein [Mariprofundales bacterium]